MPSRLARVGETGETRISAGGGGQEEGEDGREEGEVLGGGWTRRCRLNSRAGGHETWAAHS